MKEIRDDVYSSNMTKTKLMKKCESSLRLVKIKRRNSIILTMTLFRFGQWHLEWFYKKESKLHETKIFPKTARKAYKRCH